MVQFKNAVESHSHSLEVLNLLYNYDSFLDNLEYIGDFGAGSGLDTQWWATLETRDDPPEPRNYKVYALDKNISTVDENIINLPNVKFLQRDLESDHLVPRPLDLIWSHNVFQYLINPIGTLRNWNKQMNVDGMLLLMFQQSTNYSYNRYQNWGYNYCYYNHNIINLIYMLAVNGFDCRDAYFYKEQNDPWIKAAVYKSNLEPMDPYTTSWYKLVECNLLSDSVVECINRYGNVRQEEIVTTWLDKDFHFPKE